VACNTVAYLGRNCFAVLTDLIEVGCLEYVTTLNGFMFFFTAKMLVYKDNGCYSAKLNNKLDALTDGIYAITPITVATAKSILLSQGCTVRVHPLSSKLPPPSLTPKFLHRNFSVM